MENFETREQQQTLIQKRGIALEWVTDLYTSGSHHKELLFFFHISSEAVNRGKVFATGQKVAIVPCLKLTWSLKVGQAIPKGK